MPEADIDKLLAALNEGSNQSRCAAIRALCPCRNNRVRDRAVWSAIFRKAREGGLRERDQAAHAIGTLTEKAANNEEWRDLLHAFRDELDALMRHTRSARVVLGQMKKHGHAHRGAARQGYRRRRTVLDLKTPAELADWANQHLGLSGRRRVAASDPGLLRLWRWLANRVRRQPGRRTTEPELVARGQRYLPTLFQTPANVARSVARAGNVPVKKRRRST